jgi:hypothetical protein
MAFADRWQALRAAEDRTAMALRDLIGQDTPAHRTAMGAAVRAESACLAAIIGAVAAGAFLASWERYEEAEARYASLLAAVWTHAEATAADADATDCDWLGQCAADRHAAFAEHLEASMAKSLALSAAQFEAVHGSDERTARCHQ